MKNKLEDIWILVTIPMFIILGFMWIVTMIVDYIDLSLEGFKIFGMAKRSLVRK